MTINSAAVFCASSPEVDGEYLQAAGELGRALAGAGWTVYYGGGAVGLMGAVADAALAEGGRVIGVRPRFISQIEADHPGVTEMIFTDTVHERIGLLLEQADAFITLPGSCGTLDELVEAITWKRLGLHNKAVAILNTRGFFDPLGELFGRMIHERFVRSGYADLYHLCPDVPAVLDYLRGYQAPPCRPL